MGIISARYLEHPFETGQKYFFKTEVPNLFERIFCNYNSGLLRFCLINEVFLFAFIRFSMTDLGILVGFLCLGTMSAFFMISKNLLVTNTLFFN
jgi:hypothetical protein